MKSLVTRSSFIGVLLAIAIASAGCSRETPSSEGAFATELKGAPPPGPRAVGKVGIPDDSIKPAPLPISRGGIPDDSIKPRPLAPLPTPAPR